MVTLLQMGLGLLDADNFCPVVFTCSFHYACGTENFYE